MSLLKDIPLSALHFYLTASYPCSYLQGLQARSQVAMPDFLINAPVYSELVQHGFRRSGNHTYRPQCEGCRACVPLRVLAGKFTANRSQRRAWAQHSNLQTSLHPLEDKPEYYDLYRRYQRARHPGGGMEDHDSYLNCLLQSNVGSLLVEFREPFGCAQDKPFGCAQDKPFGCAQDRPFGCAQDRQGALRMVSVIDLLCDGLSSVYTFYEPDLPRARFGVYNVLWQIELCRRLELDFVYLGYWIEHSDKMAYKTTFQPAQGLMDGAWNNLKKESR